MHPGVAIGQVYLCCVPVDFLYRRSVMLASGRYAMLDDGMGFSLVPWKPVIEQRLGLHISAVSYGASVNWQMARQRGIAL